MSPTTREVDAAKAERLRREARYYTPDRLGRRCPACHTALPLALVHVGETTHPCCDPSFQALLAASAAAESSKETP